MVTYPKDWREKTFNAFLKIKRGASPRPIESYLTSNIGGVNWIKIGDAPRYGKYITSTEEKITNYGCSTFCEGVSRRFYTFKFYEFWKTLYLEYCWLYP